MQLGPIARLRGAFIARPVAVRLSRRGRRQSHSQTFAKAVPPTGCLLVAICMCLTLARAITAGPPYEWSPPHTGGLQLPTREAARRPGHLFCVGRVGNNGREPRGQTSPQVRLQRVGTAAGRGPECAQGRRGDLR